jgi:hypothetical protein
VTRLCSVCRRPGHDRRRHDRRANPPPAHRITVKKLRHVVDSHGPYAMAEVTIGGRSTRVRTRRPHGGRDYTADEMIEMAARQLGVTLPRRNPSPGFSVRRLGPTPRRAVGYRTLRVNDRQRVRIALLAGGGSKAYELLSKRKGR